ncbi:hypothetical protein F183_A22940 [Bryobacterales bacterium F-183]|nr:hypothetical protein F183_A22940 [Bryobacterales bacterium F-183]
MTVLEKSVWTLGILSAVCLTLAWWVERRLASGRLAAVILIVGLKSVGWLSAASTALLLLAAQV